MINTVTWSQDGNDLVILDVKDLKHGPEAASGYAHLTPQKAAECNKDNVLYYVAQSYIDSGEEIGKGSPFYSTYAKLLTNKADIVHDLGR